MEGHGGGSSTPSYSNMVSNRRKEMCMNNFRKPTGAETLEKEGTHKEARRETKSEGRSERMENISTTGPCKPKSNIKP